MDWRFKTRTAVLNDYVETDDELLQVLSIDGIDEINEYLHEYNKSSRFNVPLQRHSEDVGRINNVGYKMISFCKNNGLFIANGRVGSDKEKVSRVTIILVKL